MQLRKPWNINDEIAQRFENYVSRDSTLDKRFRISVIGSTH